MPRDARLSDNDCGIFQSGFDSIPYKLADFSEKFAESSVAYNVKRFSVFFFAIFLYSKSLFSSFYDWNILKHVMAFFSILLEQFGNTTAHSRITTHADTRR